MANNVSPCPPLSRKPERLKAFASYSFGETMGLVKPMVCFPELHPSAVLLPERFRGRLRLRR